ncbi:ABC transporter permease [Ornithinibacillus halophilus]|uniref:FtsX-like permease family protein n=1 Tax=Ornithinibacillus halophilus TaxID=930117 RepID=A0A1M5GRQ5_9BACI|nr:ABC transporter permease [Ornithinibacillus halophilus]SHG06429.1 FtsX-like permease family protein [Ornithinibacillus halophilus]
MIRFIWQNWWRRKERFILLLVGALIVSLGLTYLIGVSDTNKGTVVDHLQQRWSASYDIVVRPEGSRSVTEEKKLLEPNYLSGLQGGISVDQYEKIKDIPGVEVAAPIAMIGYAGYEIDFENLEFDEEGIYRQTYEETLDLGIDKKTSNNTTYFAVGDWDLIKENLSEEGYGSGVGPPQEKLSIFSYALLAGIDPEQEAKLVGLDGAVVDLGESRYFSDRDTVNRVGDIMNEIYSTDFPVLVSNHAYVDKSYQFSIERLDIDFNRENANDTLVTIKENGKEAYLDTMDGVGEKQHYTFSSEEAFRLFVNSVAGADMETGEMFEEDHLDRDAAPWIVDRPSPLQYKAVKSPFSERWPFAYQVETFQNDPQTKPAFVGNESFREPISFGKNSDDWPRIIPKWIGFYDPSKLDISKDPTTELPMETYRPATAEFVIDADGEPVNPAKTLKPTDNPYDFLTNPPGMLTTIEAAEQILGDEPISSIRVKVKGVMDLSEESQETLEWVANEIEKETGLITDITLGSSPQLTLSYVPSINDEEALGWFQQPWVNIGSAISIFREAKIGFTGVVFSVIAVAIVYVWATGLVSMLARRKEFAVLLSIGWRPGQLSKMLLYEAMILGAFVALLSWTMLSFVYVSTGGTIDLARFFLTGFFGFAIYVLGAIIPAGLIQKIEPYEAMRTGEISKSSKRILKTKGLVSMAFNHFIGKWRRSILSVVSIALPTGLLGIFLYISLRLKGIMYTTWLGQYVALEVGPVQYAAIIVALVIAILTTAEIMWQNITERQEEIALLKSIGWKNHVVRWLILLEGVFSGIFAAVIGVALAFVMMVVLYGQLPTEDILFVLATGLIPIIIGTIGAIFPAEKAVRIQPIEGMGGSYSNRKLSEKRLKWAVVAGAVLLTGVFTYSMVQIAPTIKEAEQLKEAAEGAFSPTDGDIVDDGGDDRVIEEAPEDEETEEERLQKEYNKYGGNVTYLGEEYFVKDTFTLQVNETESIMTEIDEGMKVVALEILYENLSDVLVDIRSRANFELYTEEGIHIYEKMTILEEANLERNRNLARGGRIKAVLEFVVEEELEPKEFIFRVSNQITSGLLIKWE